MEGVDKDDLSVDWLVNAARFEVKIYIMCRSII